MSDNTNLTDLIGYEFEPTTFSYDERDAILYALGVGAARDPLDEAELAYAYENHPAGFKVLPTFATVYAQNTMWQLLSAPGFETNPLALLHGEHTLTLNGPLPPAGTVTTRSKIAQVYDKGKGALFLLDAVTTNKDGVELATNRYGVFALGLGGFGGERGPSGRGNEPPTREPDAVHEETIPANQALLYRLSGDRNPLHADPRMADLVGFDRPILHGLCTFGYAGRAVLRHFADNDPAGVRTIQARFARHVFPGETLITEMWQVSDDRVLFRCHVAERDDAVITNATVELGPAP